MRGSVDALGVPLSEGDRIVYSVITWGCQHCQLCLMGEHNLCAGKATAPAAGVGSGARGGQVGASCKRASYERVLPIKEGQQPTGRPD
jgi:D-arabinose 1-dehydrogenase-like Zn-dependent alcohol dehydrogenase